MALKWLDGFMSDLGRNTSVLKRVVRRVSLPKWGCTCTFIFTVKIRLIAIAMQTSVHSSPNV